MVSEHQQGARSAPAVFNLSAIKYRDGICHYSASCTKSQKPFGRYTDQVFRHACYRMLPMKDAEDVPIIALTADATDEARERVRTAGMNYLVSKPIDHDKLFYYLSQEFTK